MFAARTCRAWCDGDVAWLVWEIKLPPRVAAVLHGALDHHLVSAIDARHTPEQSVRIGDGERRGKLIGIMHELGQLVLGPQINRVIEMRLTTPQT